LHRDARLLQIADGDYASRYKRMPRPKRFAQRKVDLRILLRFLAARIGEPFDTVYSELARVADPHSTSG
jgi:hypothetical protein